VEDQVLMEVAQQVEHLQVETMVEIHQVVIVIENVDNKI
jgi:uncharacterized membrane protein